QEIAINGIFVSSRRRHTSFSRDWSSDVCSSDLRFTIAGEHGHGGRMGPETVEVLRELAGNVLVEDETFFGQRDGRCQHLFTVHRSEERRVGRGVGTRWRPKRSETVGTWTEGAHT